MEPHRSILDLSFVLLICLVDRLLALPKPTVLVVLPFKLLTIGSSALQVASPQLWSSLPEDNTLATSLLTFRRRLETYLSRQSFPHLALWLYLYIFFSIVDLAVMFILLLRTLTVFELNCWLLIFHVTSSTLSSQLHRVLTVQSLQYSYDVDHYMAFLQELQCLKVPK